MLPEQKKKWFHTIEFLSIIWALGLTLVYVLYYGWFQWPLVIARKIWLGGTIYLPWWMVFSCQVFSLALVCLIFFEVFVFYEKRKETRIKDPQTAFRGGLIGFILFSVLIALISVFLGLFVAGRFGAWVSGILGFFIGAFLGFVIGMIYFPQIKEWLKHPHVKKWFKH
jgi:hypothetical protein